MANSVLKSLLAGLSAFILAVSAVSFIMVKKDIPDKFMFLSLLSAALLSAFAASFYLTRKVSLKGLLSGIIASSLLCVLEITGIAVFNYGKISNLIFALAISMPLMGALTGIFAANFRRKIKRS